MMPCPSCASSWPALRPAVAGPIRLRSNQTASRSFGLQLIVSGLAASSGRVLAGSMSKVEAEMMQIAVSGLALRGATLRDLQHEIDDCR